MTFDQHLLRDERTGLVVDLTDAPPGEGPDLRAALAAMAALEAGSIANPDEGRMVGHYWLRAPQRAPDPALTLAIEDALRQVEALGAGRAGFTELLWIGIGGSALGPQLVDDCLRQAETPLRVWFLDNTDPEGFVRVLSGLELARTLVVVVSKSGGTVETRNGQLAVQAAFAAAGLDFGAQAVAVTGEGSRLWAEAAGWRARVPMWDWVGGRTSVTGPVGAVLMALCGYDLRGFLQGAADCDALTRQDENNPAAALASAWFRAGGGQGTRALVIEPYKDRYQLLSRYLQQLVMESLGKHLDRQGRVVHQGLTVYGNKGSTDQHAFVQQLRDGRDDAFVHFIETADPGPAVAGADGFLASDHLLGFLAGTRSALAEAGRPSITVQVPDVSARSLGVLVALFERAVGLYAELIDTNAYHQPGVEAGKKAALATTALLQRLATALRADPQTAEELSMGLGAADPRLCWRLLHHLASSGRARVVRGARPHLDRFVGAGD